MVLWSAAVTVFAWLVTLVKELRSEGRARLRPRAADAWLVVSVALVAALGMMRRWRDA
ncbi:MAG TPA: hypothetical protein VF771_10275 [Longimicrobiaceae bacterium]